MDNLTHTLFGLCLAKSGLERATPLATATLVISSNLPDIDALMRLRGSLSNLEYHRGITHSFVGLAVLAGLLTLLLSVADLVPEISDVKALTICIEDAAGSCAASGEVLDRGRIAKILGGYPGSTWSESGIHDRLERYLTQRGFMPRVEVTSPDQPSKAITIQESGRIARIMWSKEIDAKPTLVVSKAAAGAYWHGLNHEWANFYHGLGQALFALPDVAHQFTALGDRWGLGMTLSSLGDLEHVAGAYDAAVPSTRLSPSPRSSATTTTCPSSRPNGPGCGCAVGTWRRPGRSCGGSSRSPACTRSWWGSCTCTWPTPLGAPASSTTPASSSPSPIPARTPVPESRSVARCTP